MTTFTITDRQLADLMHFRMVHDAVSDWREATLGMLTVRIHDYLGHVGSVEHLFEMLDWFNGVLARKSPRMTFSHSDLNTHKTTWHAPMVEEMAS